MRENMDQNNSEYGHFLSTENLRKPLYFEEKNSPANIYLFKVSKRNTRKRGEVSSKLTRKHRNEIIGVVLVFLLLILNTFHTFAGALAGSALKWIKKLTLVFVSKIIVYFGIH